MTTAPLENENIAVRVTLLQTNEAGDVTPVTLYREGRKRRRRRTRRECGAVPGCGGDRGCKARALKVCKSPLLAAAAGPKIIKALAGCGFG